MAKIQYTIRNVPMRVDAFLRERSCMSGKSLNQVVIDELSENVPATGANMREALAWFIGIRLDQATTTALEREDSAAKKLSAKQLLDGPVG